MHQCASSDDICPSPDACSLRGCLIARLWKKSNEAAGMTYQCQSCLHTNISVIGLMAECGRQDCNIHPMQKETKMHCRQCMGSCNDPNKCQCEPCELRLREMAIRKSTNPNVKPKMTRQEAIANLKRVGPIDAIGLIDALEAVGLLKFEEENDPDKKVYDLIRAHYALPRSEAHIAANNLINDLRVRGYKIVRNA